MEYKTNYIVSLIHFKVMKKSFSFLIKVNSKTRRWFSNGFNTFRVLLSNESSKGKYVMLLIFPFFSLFKVFQVSFEAPKRNYNITFKVFKPTSFSLGWMIFYMFTLQFLVDMCNHWHFAVEKYVCSSFFFLPPPIFSLLIKVGHTKICFSVALTQCPVNSEVFFRLSRFSKATGHLRDTCCRVGDEGHRSLMSFCRGEKKEQRPSPDPCLIGVWCCCMCYAVQKLAFPCRWCGFHVKSRATCYWEVGPLRSGSRCTPWCRCGSGCGCCVGGTGSSGWSSPPCVESDWLFCRGTQT